AGVVGAVQQSPGSLLQVENHGEINAMVDLNAVVEGGGGFAYASGGATGVDQFANGAVAKLALINVGAINADVHAVATATTEAGIAIAWAKAFGVDQSNLAATGFQAFDNSGSIDAQAIATATGLARGATALAVGYKVRDGGDVPSVAAVSNSGAISVNASANAAGSAAELTAPGTLNGPFDAGSATAAAWGIYFDMAAPLSANPIKGTITNAGSIDVAAVAAGETMTTVVGSGSFVTTVTVGGSSALATGIRIFGGVNTMTITNSGAISVDAITFNDGYTRARGILARAAFPMLPSPDDILTINNMGDIIVRESIDGGQTWRRGLAIDVAGNPDNFAPGLPNKTVINLLGGNIYGNIAIQHGDMINVQRAETAFDGIINPVCMQSALAGGGLPGSCGVGTLAINEGGTLFLQDPRFPTRSNMYDGPSYAFVEALDMQAGSDGATGTIAFGLQPVARGLQPAGSYPQLFADLANLDGTLEVRLSATPRTLADNYFWDNVIDANSLAGTFDNCLIGGAYGRSVLLGKLNCIYDDANNVDLSLARVPFDKVHGLDRNARAVGARLERMQDGTMSKGVAGLIGDLFLIDDEKTYDRLLGILGGEGYADYLSSFVALGVRYNDVAEDATRCSVAGPGCRELQPVRIWGLVDDQQGGTDAIYGGGLSRRSTNILGADVSIGSAAIVGFSAGKVGNGVQQAATSETMESEGFQLGGYAAWDPGSYFVRGAMTFSRFEGDSTRNINLRSFGGAFAGAVGGDPDVTMWTLGLHAGARIGLGSGSLLTPYANLDHVHAELGGFTERTGWGNKASELTVRGGRVAASFAGAGAKWEARIGGFSTEASVGFRYRLGDRRSALTAAFSGSERDAFQIVSDAEKRGTFLADFSLGGRLGRAELKMGYAGEINGEATRHRGEFSVVLPLGRAGKPLPD
ncbi:MAG TPA: autotransporter outer membrane beta-barrel domain-containing protein, partial [Pseudorhodoplanes sp.]|nr:autotransporter outer membrane beta-barrel domain-containing protein [Pseudorhodoplanes sp.]